MNVYQVESRLQNSISEFLERSAMINRNRKKQDEQRNKTKQNTKINSIFIFIKKVNCNLKSIFQNSNQFDQVIIMSQQSQSKNQLFRWLFMMFLDFGPTISLSQHHQRQQKTGALYQEKKFGLLLAIFYKNVDPYSRRIQKAQKPMALLKEKYKQVIFMEKYIEPQENNKKIKQSSNEKKEFEIKQTIQKMKQELKLKQQLQVKLREIVKHNKKTQIQLRKMLAIKQKSQFLIKQILQKKQKVQLSVQQRLQIKQEAQGQIKQILKNQEIIEFQLKQKLRSCQQTQHSLLLEASDIQSKKKIIFQRSGEVFQSNNQYKQILQGVYQKEQIIESNKQRAIKLGEAIISSPNILTYIVQQNTIQ